MAAARFWWMAASARVWDVFKALALGADAVLIARPFVNAIYGAGARVFRCMWTSWPVSWPTPCRCAVRILWPRSPRIWCGYKKKSE